MTTNMRSRIGGTWLWMTVNNLEKMMKVNPRFEKEGGEACNSEIFMECFD